MAEYTKDELDEMAEQATYVLTRLKEVSNALRHRVPTYSKGNEEDPYAIEYVGDLLSAAVAVLNGHARESHIETHVLTTSGAEPLRAGYILSDATAELYYELAGRAQALADHYIHNAQVLEYKAERGVGAAEDHTGHGCAQDPELHAHGRRPKGVN